MTARAQGWEAKLRVAVEAYRGKAFSWGSSDCLLFAASCVEALIGTDPAAQYRGTYSDAAGALAILKGLGVADAVSLLGARYSQIAKGQACRGDLAVITEPSADDPLGAIGVVLGPIVAGYGAKGLQFVSLATITRAFKVE